MRAIVTEQIEAEGAELMTMEIRQGETGLEIVAMVRSEKELEASIVEGLAEIVDNKLDTAVEVEMIILPVIRSSTE